MTVLVVARVTVSLRGKLTRWMLEVHPGVFVGTLSARVRERLWALVTGSRRTGACTLIARAPGEQGFSLTTAGDPGRAVVDYDGMLLLRRPPLARGRRRKPTAP
jgi:CRISPR-associated protein Cas2